MGHYLSVPPGRWVENKPLKRPKSHIPTSRYTILVVFLLAGNRINCAIFKFTSLFKFHYNIQYFSSKLYQIRIPRRNVENYLLTNIHTIETKLHYSGLW